MNIRCRCRVPGAASVDDPITADAGAETCGGWSARRFRTTAEPSRRQSWPGPASHWPICGLAWRCRRSVIPMQRLPATGARRRAVQVRRVRDQTSPHYASSVYDPVRWRTIRVTEPALIGRMTAAAARPDLHATVRLKLHLALGKVTYDLGDPATAMWQLRAAGRIRFGKDGDYQATAVRVQRLTDRFDVQQPLTLEPVNAWIYLTLLTSIGSEGGARCQRSWARDCKFARRSSLVRTQRMKAAAGRNTEGSGAEGLTLLKVGVSPRSVALSCRARRPRRGGSDLYPGRNDARRADRRLQSGGELLRPGYPISSP